MKLLIKLFSAIGILVCPWMILIPLFLLEWITGSHMRDTPYVIGILVFYSFGMGFLLIYKYIMGKIKEEENNDTSR